MTPEIRPATPADAEACGRIIFEAFRGIADQHGFPWDFPSAEAGTQLATTFIEAPSIYGVVAELDGRVVGSNFMAEGDPIRGIGPITVDPAVQGSGVGRRLMEAALARAGDAMGVRLVQDAFNTRSMSLYASLGFDVREPLLLMQGTPRSGPDLGYAVRPMAPADLDACGTLCSAVHGIERTNELQEALRGPGDGTLLCAAGQRRPRVTLAAIGVQTGGNPWWQALLTAGSMIVVVNSVLAGVVAGLLWRSVAGPSGPLPLALAAAMSFLVSLVSQGVYGQRAFRRDLEASTVAFPAGPAGDQDR